MKKRTYGMIAAAATVGILLVGGGWWYVSHRRLTWPQLNAMIARNFPHVPQMHIHTLVAWLHDHNKRPPLLLDVRAKAEYAVSHLHNARWINTAEPVRKAMAGVPHTTPFVTYCSVGYRSSAYAQRLIHDGYTNVHDLEGSIFQWANDGLPVYRHGRVVHHVHPYNHYWGQLLKRSLWAFHLPRHPRVGKAK
jgi:rhodanese-related sulfurtransferase